ncbi:class I SAM-dependent methyltransferase [Bacillus sp. JJ1533]|uniref:class I SAM-dependent methyltransferase n=1 Tax=Bacillus sp. JJ1533 TaxID=3122959 RepID=UPI0030009FCF
MKLDRILPFARNLLKHAVNEGDYAVDATIGNGHDTAFLASLVGKSGRVFGFDIQKEAVENTTSRLKDEELLDCVSLFHESHNQMLTTIPTEAHGKIAGAVFNLGYLPGGNKEIVTKPDSTIEAIEQLLSLMKPEGVIVLVVYHGHQEGALERDRLIEYCSTLDQNRAHVLMYRFMNQMNNPPFIIAIEKR